MTNDQKKALENTKRVASNLAVLLNDKEVLVPTKYAMAVLESQQFVANVLKEVDKQLEETKIIVPEIIKP